LQQKSLHEQDVPGSFEHLWQPDENNLHKLTDSLTLTFY